jgi:hypothetical protein
MNLFTENQEREETMTETTRPCEICQAPIDPERIEVLPETRLCTEHAKKMAKYGGEFKMTLTQERISKVGSLKRNYGGVTPSQTRNTSGIEKLRTDYQAEQDGKNG